MKTKHPKHTKKTARRVPYMLLLLLGALFVLGILSLAIYAKVAISPELDEALFRMAGEDNITRFYYSDAQVGEPYVPVEWESEQLYSGEKCVHTPISQMPEHLKNAFIAIEDHRFYSHSGVDVLRTGKAAFNRIFRGGSDFGGSTITQQLIKNIGGEKEKTVKRKLKEMLRALALERRHTKQEILEAYLNVVPLGEGCVGVGAGSEIYFGKPPDALTLAEAASLACITRAPAKLSPRANPEAHLKRRNLVLSRMAELNYISKEACAEAQATPLVLAPERESEGGVLSWYTEQVLRDVEAGLLAKGYTQSAARALLYGGGLRIYTALDKKAQEAAEAAFLKEEYREGNDKDFRAGTVVFSPYNGKLVALVGDLGKKSGNRLYSYATDMRRAPGSALKPLALYAPAIEEGLITEASVFDDVPKSFAGGKLWPHNAPDRYDGLILAPDALAQSKNTVAVDLYRMLGAEHIYAVLRERFGLSGLVRSMTDAKGALHTDLAEAPLALGQLTRGESLFSLARGYLPLACEGSYFSGSTYFYVEMRDGTRLLEADDGRRQVLSPQTASVLTHMLCGVVDEGSAKNITLSTLVDTAGKTGSSSGNRDRWFIGYTPYYLCGVWCGYGSGGGAVNGTPHLSLFDKIMLPLHEHLADDARTFQMAEGLVCRTVCADSGKMLTESCRLDARGVREKTVWVPSTLALSPCKTHVCVFYDEQGDGVVYPPQKGKEGSLLRVALLDIPHRAFPMEVRITDAEYVFRDPMGTDVPEGDVPFFANAIPKGVYIGKSHEGRPFHAAARVTRLPEERERLPQPPTRSKEERLPERRLFPALPKPRLPRFPFFARKRMR